MHWTHRNVFLHHFWHTDNYNGRIETTTKAIKCGWTWTEIREKEGEQICRCVISRTMWSATNAIISTENCLTHADRCIDNIFMHFTSDFTHFNDPILGNPRLVIFLWRVFNTFRYLVWFSNYALLARIQRHFWGFSILLSADSCCVIFSQISSCLESKAGEKMTHISSSKKNIIFLWIFIGLMR